MSQCRWKFSFHFNSRALAPAGPGLYAYIAPFQSLSGNTIVQRCRRPRDGGTIGGLFVRVHAVPLQHLLQTWRSGT